LKSLHSLNADIDRHLAASEQELEALLRDTTLPNIIIRNEGRADIIMLTAEEAGTFQQTLTDISVMLKQSFDDNGRIQEERLPLVQE
jgi:hypothetical protein